MPVIVDVLRGPQEGAAQPRVLERLRAGARAQDFARRIRRRTRVRIVDVGPYVVARRQPVTPRGSSNLVRDKSAAVSR